MYSDIHLHPLFNKQLFLNLLCKVIVVHNEGEIYETFLFSYIWAEDINR
jgi:hypothetical protein